MAFNGGGEIEVGECWMMRRAKKAHLPEETPQQEGPNLSESALELRYLAVVGVKEA